MKKLFVLLGVVCVILLSSVLIRAGIVNVSPAAFAAENRSGDYVASSGGWGDYLYRNVGATEDYAVAPVDLPDNVLIKYVRFHYLDDDPTYNISMALIRSNKYTGAADELYSYLTSGDSASNAYATDYSADLPSHALTNTAACSYQAMVHIFGTGPALLRFLGMTISYDSYP